MNVVPHAIVAFSKVLRTSTWNHKFTPTETDSAKTRALFHAVAMSEETGLEILDMEALYKMVPSWKGAA